MQKLFLIVLAVSMFHAGLAQEKRYVPDFLTAQYAGSIGFLSIGAGYKVLKDNAMLSLQYGYVPERKGGKLNILSAKLLFNTGIVPLSPRTTFEPLSAGIMISYHFGSEFQSRWPGHRYPDGYYWWRTSLKVHVNTQTSFTYKLTSDRFESITGFLDLNVNELYLVSYLQNARSLSLRDIVKVGYGVRLNF